MIPLRDDNPTRSAPVVTWTLAALCVLVFLGEIGGQVPENWLLRPYLITHGHGYLSIVTSMFLHGSWQHLLGNLLYLIIFGNNVEDVLGKLKYLVFYLVCGLVAAAAQIGANPLSPVPMVGASGAIAGVLGGYLVLYPKAWVKTLVLGFIPVNVPAWALLGFWIVSQFFLQAASAMGQREGGVAYLAHIGGFACGLLLVRVFGGRPQPPIRGSIFRAYRDDR